MSEFVLDASALIAMLKQEKGAVKVAKAIASARMCVVNYAEVVSHYAHLGMPPAALDAMLDPLPITIVAADKEISRIAGRLRVVTSSAGLSLGDRYCLALAQRDGLPAWTSDTHWNLVADDVGVKVVQIR
ncbi:PilT protein [Novosphingobium sp. Rr 2-17]|uniref:type II toxin-antitoxin system VapC family toxin n=1 Tax=Novosphingobium sp. Rr 2-17 TaxID=555793 RepID=UPI0002698BFB|nr:type II toxin-antitoxin system VapC family toxin [Novosphingobium sp. Rr 2-17]EIZ78137.1 PilT protein [Novosphingobium sp. Rr 2-17]